MLLRDRNHPSIIMWSIGNEIPGMDRTRIADTAKILADYVRSIDTTRPVTAAVNNVTEQKDAFFSRLISVAIIMQKIIMKAIMSASQTG